MARTWAPPPKWRERTGPLLDDEVRLSVDQGEPHAEGEHTPDGHKYAEIIYSGCESAERAQEIKRALYRAAGQKPPVGLTYKIVKRGGEWDVHYWAVCKECARLYVVAKYGPDREAWPYNMREKKVRD